MSMLVSESGNGSGARPPAQTAGVAAEKDVGVPLLFLEIDGAEGDTAGHARGG